MKSATLFLVGAFAAMMFNLSDANAAEFRKSVQEQSGQVDRLMKRMKIK